MLDASLIRKQLKNGNWKVYIWGSADGHVSDWNGCDLEWTSKEIKNLK